MHVCVCEKAERKCRSFIINKHCVPLFVLLLLLFLVSLLPLLVFSLLLSLLQYHFG